MTDKIKDIINNFSDMKIIKALECCIIGDCDNCPFYETRELCPNLILFVSDLIKRQEAEIEELKSKNSNLTSDLTSLQNDLTSAKAEIEMDDVEIKELRIALQGYLDDLTKERNLYKKSIEELNQAKAENERLKTNLNIELENYATEYDNKIKSEAYREFAERLKEKKARYNADNFYVIDYIPSKEVDNLLKELVGDDDG